MKLREVDLQSLAIELQAAIPEMERQLESLREAAKKPSAKLLRYEVTI